MILTKKILIATRTKDGAKKLSSIVALEDNVSITCAPSAVKIKGLCVSEVFDVVVIDSPLADELGDTLIEYISKRTPSGIVFLASCEIYEIIEKKSSAATFVLKKPVSKEKFSQALKSAAAEKARMEELFYENEKLKRSIEELKLISTAKCVLIEYLKMSEPQAHRYIEKQAMDLRKTKSEIASDILNTYKI